MSGPISFNSFDSHKRKFECWLYPKQTSRHNATLNDLNFRHLSSIQNVAIVQDPLAETEIMASLYYYVSDQ